jgi:uncharacterized phage protein (TIGR02218 family)
VSITGTLDIGIVATPTNVPTNSMFVIGLDGNHYIIQSGRGAVAQSDPDPLHIGQAEDKSVQTIDATQWRTDLAASGVIDGIAGTFYPCASPIPCPGTEFFYWLGYQHGATGDSALPYGQTYAVAVRYKIDQDGAIVVDGGFLYLATGSPIPYLATPFPGFCYGAIVKSGFVYAACHMGDFTFDDYGVYLLKLPISGATVDISLGSWNSRATFITTDLYLGSAGGSDFYFSNAGGTAFNTAAILPMPDGTVRLLSYLSKYVIDNVFTGVTWHNVDSSGSEFWQVDPVLQICSSTPLDYRADFGQPWDDSGTLYNGDPSADVRNDYTAPNVATVTGGYEVTFARIFTDQPEIIRFRRYFCDGLTGAITFLETIEGGIPGVAPVQDFAMGYRESNSTLIAALSSSRFWYFGEFEFSNPCDDFASDGCAITEVPCATQWTQCWRIARKDGTAFHFTSLDRDLLFNGETYLACGSLSPSAAESSTAVGSIQNLEAQGIITSDLITNADLYGGLFDDAFVEVWIVPWIVDDRGNVSQSDVEDPRRLASGWIGAITHDGDIHNAEVLGGGSRLSQQAILKTYTAGCRWIFGGPECGKDLTPFIRSCAVILAANRATITADIGAQSGSSGVDDGGIQWADGKVVWTTGRNVGQTCEVKTVDFDSGEVVFWMLPAYLPEPGDEFDLYPGCDLTKPTCKDVYGNYLRFGGFPDVPGDDSINVAPDINY